MKYKHLQQIFTLALLLTGGIASAQVTIKGNVYGGGKLGDVKNDGTTINNTSVTVNNGIVKGSVYGGGQGVETDETKGLVEGNATVNLKGGRVERSIYGGGELGSVGTFTQYKTVTYTAGTHAGESVDVPTECADNTGLAKVVVSGGRVGRVDKAKMPEPGEDDDCGYVFCGGRGEADSITYYKAIALAVVDSTYLEISSPNSAAPTLITSSAYGGSENGLVLGNTHVKLTGGQIGVGHYKDAGVHHWDSVYAESAWTSAIAAVRNATYASTYTSYPFHECDAFPYGVTQGGTTNYYVHDIYANQYESNGGALQGSNGHSFLGNLFGGGSGYYPIAPGVWRRSAGRVNGNTTVEITGGHVLTSVYGGNEYTDVLGKSKVTMTGGTLGVPRTLDSIHAHPVTCYLFGAGMGDRRDWASTWNNVGSVEVNVTGNATVFGSVFGGGEEGHVLGDVKLTVDGANTLIGTLGYSYVDGNIFGGGRGFSGEALTAGAVGGDIDIDIKDGLILGSVYGGGRMASVEGHVDIDITGGTIGNNYESKYQHLAHSYGGNVFGGSMGRLEKLDGTTNPLWPYLAKVKSTKVTLKEVGGKNTIVKGNVYGGSEFGAVTEDAEVDIQGGTVWRDVYGGGYGSTDIAKTAPYPYQPTGASTATTVQVTPMQRAGLVEGNTEVSFSGGWVKKSIYGGGELASVGTIVNDTVNAKHTDETQTFALSWPYAFVYADGTGTATVNITGGRVGLSGKDYMGPWNQSNQPYDPADDHVLTSAEIKAAREDNGDIYGASRGVAGDRFVMAHSANVNNAVVNIEYPTSNTAAPENYKPNDWVSAFHEKWQSWDTYGALGCIPGAAYAGGENGHVITNTHLTLENGLVGHNVYGGGKGSDTYTVMLDKKLVGYSVQTVEPYPADIMSLTAGKVYGNTHVHINGGYVVRNVYGGGNRASVGKGNYAGGPGDYQEMGYGERWATENDPLRDSLANSGHTYVNVYGGQIGTRNGDKDDLPTGNVFGGCRGSVAANGAQILTPQIYYYPNFYLGYTNHSHVTIGETAKATPDANSPVLYGSVYGGGQDGHVRWGTHVIVNDAKIGNEYTADNITAVGTDSKDHYQWQGRGNVYGSGSGMTKYDSDGDGVDDMYGYTSGSVTQFTTVDIKGGLIHRNVYGGGSLSTVGPPHILLPYEAGSPDTTLAKVNVYSAIGKPSDVIQGYGGNVYGGSRGIDTVNVEFYSTAVFTEVNLGTGANVPGNVYGGGEMGQVKRNTKVNMNGGTVGTVSYTWKQTTTDHTQPYDSIVHATGGKVFGGGRGSASLVDGARVKENTEVNINGGHVLYNVYGGGEMASVGQHTVTYEDDGTTVKDYEPVANTGLAQVNVTGGQVGPAPKEESGYAIPIGLDGTDGYVFGGGQGIGDDPISATNPYGQYYTIANVNYTKVTVDIPSTANTTSNRIWGSVFGGSEDGHVLGSDTVYYKSGLLGTKGTTSYDGNIFGGGRNFSKKNYTAGRTRGNNIVEMSGGQVYGNIYGGGRLALTGCGLYGLVKNSENKYSPMLSGDHGKTKVMVKGGIVGNDALIVEFSDFSMGNVYGGGKGDMGGITVAGHPAASALMLGMTKNTEVEISGDNTHVYGIVFGGGEIANVGHYAWDMDYTATPPAVSNIAVTEGLAKVTIDGGVIGGDRSQMRYELADPADPLNWYSKYNDDLGYVYGGGEGWSDDPDNTALYPQIHQGSMTEPTISLLDLMATVNSTEVTINGGWVKASVFGGAESGHVRGDTKVTVKGGQIGAGYSRNTSNEIVDLPYANGQFIDPLMTEVTNGNSLSGTYCWNYHYPYNPYDPAKIRNQAVYNGGTGETTYGYVPSDGKSWFGNVFGGGSGWFPYVTNEGTDTNPNFVSHWNPNSGKVWGNTEVIIEGGHILNNVYGANESTNVEGTATVKVKDGTVGVPRTIEQIVAQPTISNVFGGGCGDPRPIFNSLTNVASTDVQITGGTIYGSVFGGAEDGHVLGDAAVSVGQAEGKTTVIGSTGRSQFDGNVFGGGRGFSGESLNAGVVTGNVDIDIDGGTILGSIYGGGRLASVGTYIVPEGNEHYGRLQSGADHGYVTIDITGGTIGNDYESKYTHPDHTTGGNVYGGAMGRLVGLDGNVNPLWPSLGFVKYSTVNIGQDNTTNANNRTTIKGTVYGGGEYGCIARNAEINMTGGTVWRDLYGGGRGSDDNSTAMQAYYHHPISHSDILTTPMKSAGRVEGNTKVTVSGGWVKKNIYGGGELASVGLPTAATANTDFALSWPVAFTYADNTGKAEIQINGGRIGVTGKDFMGPWNAAGTPLVDLNDGNGYVPYDATATGHKDALKAAREDNGDLYGGGKGKAGEALTFAHLANVNETVITINDATTTATPATFKPKWVSAFYPNMEDWPTYGALGCVSGAVYGGSENGHVNTDTRVTLTDGLVGHAIYGGGKGKDKYTNSLNQEVYCLTAGKVYGNTYININGGYVVRSVFGGGNTASVGKGNYLGYGESGDQATADASGKCTINITNGTLGMLDKDEPDEVFKDNIPYGSVFGGCRGLVEAACDTENSIESRLSFVNNTEVNISGNAMLHGSVFGGGQDGHVRWNTDVNVTGGEIGVEYRNAEYAKNTVGSDDLETMYWSARGNVFGGGSGIGKYTDSGNNEHYSLKAGSVMGKTEVDITGGRIHGDVYGGGNLGTVGDNNLETTGDTPVVTISGNAKVGLASDVNGIFYEGEGLDRDTIYFSYGGSVFGAGRGIPSDDLKNYCNVETTSVAVSGGRVFGDVYGGGEDGHVLGNTQVTVSGGTVGTYGVSNFDGNVFGGGKGSGYYQITGTGLDADTTFVLNPTCGRVGGNTNVTMSAGYLKSSIFGGGRLALTGVNADGVFPNTPVDWVVADHGNTNISVSGGVVGTYATDSLLICDYSVGDIFGSGKGDIDNYESVAAGRVTNANITISGDNTIVHGGVFGGGEMAGIGWWGSDAKYYANTGAANITINGGSIGSEEELYYTKENNPGDWTIYDASGQLIHTCTGNVYGGSQGDVDPESPAWVSMARSREATVTINDGSVMSGVYGGGEQGAVTGNTQVTINGGTIGSLVTGGANSFFFGDVFGAGYGSDNSNYNNNTAANDSTLARTALGLPWTPAVMAGRVYGNSRVDVMGGTLRGNVYGGGERAYLGYELSNTTTSGNALVNVGRDNAGVLEGGVTFAGSGEVFGANKFIGTPYGDVTVNIYKTAHVGDPSSVSGLGNYYPDPLPNPVTVEWMRTLPKERQNYAIQAVYGGGDMADYLPRWEGKKVTTHVYDCKENTIFELYGGGNAAAVGDVNASYRTNTYLIVDGGRIHHLFGGGNGLVVPADITGAANTTIYGGLIDEAYGGSNSAGFIYAINMHNIPDPSLACPMIIDTTYSGGNEADDIGEIYHSIECVGGGTHGTFYGGASGATIYGNVHCDIYGGTINNLFGGSKGSPTRAADILKYPMLEDVLNDSIINYNPNYNNPDSLCHYSQRVRDHMHAHPELGGTGGNVTLNIWGGAILENAFGGSDVNGRIQGKITVNVIDLEGDCGLDLMNLYGGGQSAAYTPDLVNGQIINAPEVNVKHGTVKGNVYGGGKGVTAVVTANPVVTIGDVSTGHETYVAHVGHESVANGGNVYGGGNQANVVGNTSVNIVKANTVVRGNVFGGGQGNNAQLSDVTLGLVRGNNTVNVSGGKVYGNVYGGGQLASVTGNTTVALTGGEIGVLGDWDGTTYNNGIEVRPLSGGRVYGGGQGDDLDRDFGHVQGNAFVSISGDAQVHNCVYGGGMLGSVGNGILGDKTSGVAKVVISGGVVGPLDGSGLNAYVYGGGRGKNDADGTYGDFANVDSTSLIMTGGKVWGSIFGGSEDGHVLGDAHIDFSGGELGTTGKTSWDGNIFGGGRNYDAFDITAGRVGGNVVVNMRDNAKMKGNIYGGGRKASVGMMADGTMYPNDDAEHGNIYVNVDATVGEIPEDVAIDDWKVATSGSVYGGGMGDVAQASLGRAKNTYVKIKEKAKVVANVYGGGELGSVEQNAHVDIEGGQIGLEQAGQETVFGGSVFGGGLGRAGTTYLGYGNVDSAYVNISDGYVVNAVFGGGDNGHVMRSTDVTISGGTIGKRLTMREFYVDSLALAKTHIYTGSVMAGGKGVATIDEAGHHDDITGRVFGNTNITVTGGTIRHAVYGGGGLSSVGTYTLGSDGLPVFTSGTGKTTVTVKGNALIGPKKADLTEDISSDELADAAAVLGLTTPLTETQYINAAFRFLGLNEGWVFGGGCGLASNEDGTDDFDELTFNDSTVVNISGDAQIAGVVFGGGENGRVISNAEVNISGGTIGGFPLQGPGTHTIASGEYKDVTLTYTDANSETYEDEYGAGRNSFRGSVFGGGKGSDTIVRQDHNNPEYRYSRMAGQVFGNASVNISAGTMYGRVYGGGAIANVGKLTYDATGAVTNVTDGNINVTVTGGNIGTDGWNNGDVFGGGLGRVGAPTSPLVNVSYVGNTRVEVKGGAQIPSSVYGGSANGHVWGNTHVIIDGDETVIGSANPGGWHGNVYGGGGGSHQYQYKKNGHTYTHHSITSGRVFGNTKVEIKGGQVKHNVYGGGALASVGTYNIYDPAHYVLEGTGNDTIIITGGTIGTDGDENGMVFGSGRGVIQPLDHFMDSLTYAVKTAVIIGTEGATDNTTPKINGSVYGSGENGHVYEKAVVKVYSGTIGCTADEYAAMSVDDKTNKFPYRGNVYGAGCGTDQYDSNNDGTPDAYNRKSGIVQGETEVDIHGGYISRNVYGGGAMATVGFLDETPGQIVQHTNTDTESALSWPYELNFAFGGTARVNIRGGHIGTEAAPAATSGNVFGSSRGKAADRYDMGLFANVKDAYVNVDFTPDDNNRIVGSVFGSGESGHVYNNTYVTIEKGLVMGSVFGAGDGTETYEATLLHATAGDDGHGNSWNAGDPYVTDVRSITAGKVYGNTNVTVNGGTIQHNVYGGGNMASVGKGNYKGYGEGGEILDGVTNVSINGGSTIGTNGYIAEGEDNLLNGFVFGSSRGATYPTVTATPRYNYTRDFFLGYVNQSNVTIGDAKVMGSVLGGGDNGHVRLNTNVSITDGEIGVTYDPDDGAITDAKWKYRGNVYGAGRGVDFIPGTTEYCTSAGSVTRNTTVTVSGGTIHRDVYGGGSLSTVGPPPGYNEASLTTVNILGGTVGDVTGIAHMYGGNVYGSGRGEIAAPGNTLDRMATVNKAVVNIGANEGGTFSGNGLVNASVYGSGENGHVSTDATVNIYGGRIGDTDNTDAQANTYCGNVFGAGSGTDMYDSNNDGTPDAYNPVAGIVKGNADINIHGGWVMRSVYGGGEMASVGTIQHDPAHGIDTANYKHTDPNTEYALSWPYEFSYADNTGTATVNVYGGRIGITGKDAGTDNGDIYGGGKGMAGPSHMMAHFGNVKETYVNIQYPDDNTATPDNYKTLTEQCITGAVYGGSENGHVNNNTNITLTKGLVGHAVYGGGKGKGKYNGQYSLTAGKVYGNTNVTINGGYVVRCVFGGGNLASVGKGNYRGYGETGDQTVADNSGHTYVTVTDGQLGILNPDDPTKAFKDNSPYGTVFGGCRGNVVADVIDRFGYVNHTHVTIGDDTHSPRLYGSVFGGAQDGHVRYNTSVVVNNGVIGAQFGTDVVANDPAINGNYNDMNWRARGNVFGGGSGANTYTDGEGQEHSNPNVGSVSGNTHIVINGGTLYHDVFGGGNMAAVGKFANQDPHPEENAGHTRVFINGGTVGDEYGATHMYGGNVFGGGNQGFVQHERVVTVNGGTVEGDVFGGSNIGIADTVFLSLKTVNIRGGHIKRGVYGSGHMANEGDPDDPTAKYKWTGFVNITGGTIDDEVFAAGNGGTVTGSLCVNIGKEAILNAPAYVNFSDPTSGKANQFYNVKEDGTAYSDADLPMGKLIIRGDVYGGSHHFGYTQEPHWNEFDVTGFSVVFADGTGYNTESNDENADNYMYIGRSVFGSGKRCESGSIGRGIVIRNYGKRVTKGGTGADKDEMVDATRSLNTIQRGGIVVLDNTNLNLSGARPISRPDYDTKYGVAKADLGFYAINASGIVLGATDDPVYMDSIKVVKSMYLPEGASVYANVLGGSAQSNWETVGIMDGNENAKLYRLKNTGTANAPEITPEALDADEENVIIFNDESKLWVRYNQNGTTKYGELEGFFRMRGDAYKPDSTISFAYARPKIINYPGLTNENTDGGGFLSYNTPYNYFTDNGDLYTKSNQHPYTNVLTVSKDDRQDFRMWVGTRENVKHWYVDGRDWGWGRDDKTKREDEAGLYPDKPKKTLFGKDASNNGIGVVSEQYTVSADQIYNYDYNTDLIYIVGALSEFDEAVIQNSTYFNPTEAHPKPLMLYRYPGGHPMSNGMTDMGGGYPSSSDWGVATGSTTGPGANYGALLEVPAGREITMKGAVLDGLYGYTEDDAIKHQIPESFNQAAVYEPIVLTHAGSTLSLSDSTVLKRGYNGRDAEYEWYNNSDYTSYEESPNAPGAGGFIVPNGGAMFVDTAATVRLSGKVYINDNVQRKGEGTISNNVYLPSFGAHLFVDGTLDASSRIGVTSPMRNTAESYEDNTLSPVAEFNSNIAAYQAWQNNNFLDDQQWFFGSGDSLSQAGQSTFFEESIERSRPPRLSFGWTWANVVRTEPAGFRYSSLDSPEDLAWLISQSAGLNGQTATTFAGETLKQVGDIDLKQYVWVPIETFSGNYDGQGHLIKNLSVAYIGRKDGRYNRKHYGMFGRVVNGTVNRTFVVSGIMAPQASAPLDDFIHIGGLVGSLEGGMVSNSEAALNIFTPNIAGDNVITGGLVANVASGEIHSSMAMPRIATRAKSTGPVGGLVGTASGGTVCNSFVNGVFSLYGAPSAGGLMGSNSGASMWNCYANWGTEGTLSTTFKGIVNEVTGTGVVDNCYDKQDSTIEPGTVGSNSAEFTQTVNADMLGYMYEDNKVQTGTDTYAPLFKRLNQWVDDKNGTGHKYARWARPGLSEVNGDLPVLLLNEYDVISGGVSVSHQGSFRSLSTYGGTRALQYGGPVRDGNELDAALTRTLQQDEHGNDLPEYLFVYGDVTNVGPALGINRAKVSIHEDVALTNPGTLGTFANTYVGVTFDNSHTNGVPVSSLGMNYMDEQPLPRDWHMFATPLGNAPLGFDYKGDNVAGSEHINNPWVSQAGEFSWLTAAGSEECGTEADYRYWMKEFNSGTQSTDGYFPTRRGNLFTDVNALFVPNSDECPAADKYRYPYGMDLYTWTEPDYHWINFKRNGPNHWHTDEVHGVHDRIQYEPVYGGTLDANEDNLIVGRGYMASIATETFMQSHGTLNSGDKGIMLTNTHGSLLPGWNLVGNPYHGYLDFDKVGADASNNTLLSHTADDRAFYVVYDADKFADANASSAFRYYPVGGSSGGDYASRFLHPHQGFYVKTGQSTGGTLNFTESMLVNRYDIEILGDESHFRGEEKPAYPLVNLYLESDKGCADVTVIEFDRPEWGGARKMKNLRVGNGMFYAHHGDAYYAALFAQEGIDRVPLWFEAKEDDIFTMKWKLANADFHSMYLIDNITGAQYDMLKNDTYSFEGHKDDYASRFLIVFDLDGLEEQEEGEHPFAFFDGSEWVVTGDGDLQFIDALGQVLAQKHISGQTRIILPLVADGPYLFRLNSSTGIKTQKVIITK